MTLVVFVEIDRCTTDAIQMAATFLNAPRPMSRTAWRRGSRAEPWPGRYAPGAPDKKAARLAAYRAMSDAELFDVAAVTVALRPEDAPGPATRHVDYAHYQPPGDHSDEVHVASRPHPDRHEARSRAGGRGAERPTVHGPSDPFTASARRQDDADG